MLQAKQPTPNTLEVPSALAVPYQQHWRDFREANDFVNIDDVYKVCRLGSYLGTLASQVIRGADAAHIELEPDMQTHEPQEATISNAVAEWDRTTDSFNPMNEGQGDLLRAAGLLMQANFSGHPEKFGLPSTESDEVYERFASLFGNNDLALQRPTNELLLTGQLIHKAGWIEKDENRQEQLFCMAISTYDRIYADQAAEWSDRLLASQYRADIYFHWLDQDIRSAIAIGDRDAVEASKALAVELLKEQLADLRQMGRFVEAADNSTDGAEGSDGHAWAGSMLESFASIAARNRMYVRSELQTAPEYSVRRAFRHEDEPRNFKLKPRRSFDIVMQRRAADGTIVHTTPVQLKLLGRKDEHKAGSREQGYGAIPVVVVKRCSPEKMMEAADNLLVAYAEGELDRGEGPLGRVEELLNNVFENQYRLPA